jgi:predicted ATPase
LRKGLEVLTGLPDGLWRQQKELDLQTALGSALIATAGWASAAVDESLSRAQALAEQLDRPEDLVPLLATKQGFHCVRAEHRLAHAVGEQLEQIGNARTDAATQLLGHFYQGEACLFLGEFVAARTLLERCIDLADPAHHTLKGLSVDPYANLLAWLALTLSCLGYIDQARSRMDEAVSEARRISHVHTLTLVLTHAVWLDSLVGLPAVHTEELVALSTEHRFPYYLSGALSFRGQSLIGLGQAEEGLALLMQGQAQFRSIGSALCQPESLTWRAEAHIMLRQPAEARNCLADAARLVDVTEERYFEAELHQVRGNLLVATGDRSGAESHYRQAIAVAERQSAKLFQLRASTSLARLWRDQGRQTQAHDLLAPIYGWFTEGFDAPDLKEAKALLDELA